MADKYFLGNSGATWALSTNWSPAGAPTNGDNVYLQRDITGTLTIAGSGLSIDVASFIVEDTGSPYYTWVVGATNIGTWTFSNTDGIITVNTPKTTSYATTAFNFDGSITGLGKLRKLGTGDLGMTMIAGVSYTFSELHIEQGTVHVGGGGTKALGLGNVKVYEGAGIGIGSTAANTITSKIDFLGNGTIFSDAGSTTGALTLSGIITIPSGKTITIDLQGDPATISGQITGTGASIVKIGTKPLTLSNTTNTFTYFRPQEGATNYATDALKYATLEYNTSDTGTAAYTGTSPIRLGGISSTYSSGGGKIVFATISMESGFNDLDTYYAGQFGTATTATFSKYGTGTFTLGYTQSGRTSGATYIYSGSICSAWDYALYASTGTGTTIVAKDAEFKISGTTNTSATAPLTLGGSLHSLAYTNHFRGPITLSGDAYFTADGPVSPGVPTILNTYSLDLNSKTAVITGDGTVKWNNAPTNASTSNALIYGNLDLTSISTTLNRVYGQGTLTGSVGIVNGGELIGGNYEGGKTFTITGNVNSSGTINIISGGVVNGVASKVVINGSLTASAITIKGSGTGWVAGTEYLIAQYSSATVPTVTVGSWTDSTLPNIGNGTVRVTPTGIYFTPVALSTTLTINSGTPSYTTANSLNSYGFITVGGTGTFQPALNVTGYNYSSRAPALILNSGGTFQSSNSFNTFDNVSLNGGVIRARGGYTSIYPSFMFRGTVTATADTIIYHEPSGYNAYTGLMIGSNATVKSTTFNVNSGKYVDIQTLVKDGSWGSGTATEATKLIKTGAGTLKLKYSNTYSGGTDISAGVVQVGDNAALGTGLVTMTGGTISSSSSTGYTLANALALNGPVTLGDATNTGSLTLTGTLSGTGTLTKANSTYLFLHGPTNTNFTGNVVVNSGFLFVGDYNVGTPNQLSNVNTIEIKGAIQYRGINSYTVTSKIKGDGTIYVDNTNSSGITFTGDLTEFLGSLRIEYGTDSTTTAQRITLTDSTQFTASNIMFMANAQNNRVIPQTLRYTGTNAVTFNNIIYNNVFANNDSELSIIENASSSGATMDFGSTFQHQGTNLNAASTFRLATSWGAINWSGNIIEGSTGTLHLSKTGIYVANLSGDNTFKGTVDVSAGRLNANSATALGNTTTSNAITVSSGATLSLGAAATYANKPLSISGSGISYTVGALSLDNSGTNTFSAITVNGANTYIRSTDNATLIGAINTNGYKTILGSGGVTTGDYKTLTVSGVVSGLGELTVCNSSYDLLGNVVLTGVNTYTGNTTVGGGTLEVSGLLGSGTYAGNLSITSGSTLTFSNNTTNQYLNGPITGTGTFKKSGTNGIVYTGGPSSFSGNIIIDSYNFFTNNTAIPPPSTGNTFPNVTSVQVINPGARFAIRTNTAYSVPQTFTGNGIVAVLGNVPTTFGAGKLVGLTGNSGPYWNGVSAWVPSCGLEIYSDPTLVTNTVVINDLPYRVNFRVHVPTNSPASSLCSYIGSGGTFPSSRLVVFAQDANSQTYISQATNKFSANHSGITPLIIGGGITREGYAATNTVAFTLGGTNTAANEIKGDITETTGGAISIIKEDAGTWVLSGNNTYTGNTTVTAGKLSVIGSNSYSNIVISSGTSFYSYNNPNLTKLTLLSSNVSIGGNSTFNTNITLGDSLNNKIEGSNGTLTLSNLTLQGQVTFSVSDSSNVVIGNLTSSYAGTGVRTFKLNAVGNSSVSGYKSLISHSSSLTDRDFLLNTVTLPTNQMAILASDSSSIGIVLKTI